MNFQYLFIMIKKLIIRQIFTFKNINDSNYLHKNLEFNNFTNQ